MSFLCYWFGRCDFHYYVISIIIAITIINIIIVTIIIITWIETIFRLFSSMIIPAFSITSFMFTRKNIIVILIDIIVNIIRAFIRNIIRSYG